ncbi:MAG: hypothetical protein EBS55_12440 [Flavobacteriaceae bacterium]|nr:hypothetical protein [Flavobacteriaceae bacterium]
MKRIWVNGTFDVLHIGHIKLIQHAASLGLVRIGIDTDERVKEKKGVGRPFNTLKDRIEFISAIKGVESVVSFGSDTELIEKIKDWDPDIMVIGNDYKYHEIIGVEYVPKIEFFEKIEGISTTKILGDEKE